MQYAIELYYNKATEKKLYTLAVKIADIRAWHKKRLGGIKLKRNFLFLILLLASGLLLYGCVEKHEKLHHVESVKDVFFHDDGIYYQNNYWGTITDDSMLSKEEFLKNLGLVII